MERLSLSLAPPQITWLRREAKRLGVTIGELLRRIIDVAREQKDAR